MTKKQAEQLSQLIHFRHNGMQVRSRVVKPFDDRHGYRVAVEKGPAESPDLFRYNSPQEYAKDREILASK